MVFSLGTDASAHPLVIACSLSFYIVDLSLLFIDTQQEVFDLDMSPQYLQRMIARFLLFMNAVISFVSASIFRPSAGL